jgi:hypothetical protein
MSGVTAGVRGSAGEHVHRPPADCPVCGSPLRTTRLSCGTCGSELSGVFSGCPFCALDGTDRELLEVFLVSRGNMREVERHLGVSYPTARQRYAELLDRLGLGRREPVGQDKSPGGEQAAAGAPDRDEILRALAAGTIAVDEAERWLRGR